MKATLFPVKPVISFLVIVSLTARSQSLRFQEKYSSDLGTRAASLNTNFVRAFSAASALDSKRAINKQIQELYGAVGVRNLSQHTEAFALKSAIWPVGSVIHVGWENPEPQNEAERQWVRAAIEKTWECACGIRFTGWEKAQPGDRGIRIRISDEGPYCKRLGKFIDGLDSGMVLNFTFHNWSPACFSDQQVCIQKIAVHEFGHAIGFAHEHNRPDTPIECQEPKQGEDGDFPVTLYDPLSIMNYCNPTWSDHANNGLLSDLDVEGAKFLYGNSDKQCPPPLKP